MVGCGLSNVIMLGEPMKLDLTSRQAKLAVDEAIVKIVEAIDRLDGWTRTSWVYNKINFRGIVSKFTGRKCNDATVLQFANECFVSAVARGLIKEVVLPSTYFFSCRLTADGWLLQQHSAMKKTRKAAQEPWSGC
jgi:hypothetical protein